MWSHIWQVTKLPSDFSGFLVWGPFLSFGPLIAPFDKPTIANPSHREYLIGVKQSSFICILPYMFNLLDFPHFSIWSHIWQVMNGDLGYMVEVLCLGSAGSLAVPCLGSVCLVLTCSKSGKGLDTTTQPPSAAGGGCAAAVVVSPPLPLLDLLE